MALILLIISSLSMFLTLKIWSNISHLQDFVRESEGLIHSIRSHEQKINILLHHLDVTHERLRKKEEELDKKNTDGNF